MERHLTLKWRGAELSFQCRREWLGRDRCRILFPRRWTKASSYLSPCAQSGLAEGDGVEEQIIAFFWRTPDLVNSEMGFMALFYPSSLLSFHKQEDYFWCPDCLEKGPKHTRAGCSGQLQRALSFLAPSRHTHTEQSPPLSLWMCVCTWHKPFKDSSKPGENSRTSVLSLSTSCLSVKRHRASRVGMGIYQVLWYRRQGWHCLHQGFLTLVLLTFWARQFSAGGVGALLCPAGCLAESLVSSH